MVKKLIVCVLCLLLAGCTVIKENTQPVPEIKPFLQTKGTEGTQRSLKANLYFLNEDGQKLIADLRYITLQDGENPAEAVMRALIAGPQAAGQQKVVPEGVMLDYVEAGDDVAEVYLETGKKKPGDEEMFVFKIAAANTLIDLLDITYVNLFWDGMQKSQNSQPAGPQIKSNQTVEEALNMEQEVRAAQSSRAAYDGKAILYFAAKDGPFILPEVRNVSFNSESSVEALINELVTGPRDTGRKTGLFSKQTKFKNSDFILENNVKTLILHFESLIMPDQGYNESLMAASLIYTLTGILTDIEAVKIDIKGKIIENIGSKKFINGMRRSDFTDITGKSIPLYMIYQDSTLLTGVSRTVLQSKQWDALIRLKELFAGPKESESKNAWPVLPGGTDENDLLSVSVSNDTFIVDCSANFKNMCANLSEENEMLLIFSIVNTLTEIKGIRQVLFQIEGRPVESLSGHLYTGTPFIRNPGIIKKSLLNNNAAND